MKSVEDFFKISSRSEDRFILWMLATSIKSWDGKWGIALLDKFPECIRFLDTTLRDGEQTPGVSLTPNKKLQIARKLDELGVDIIEAGFAAVSKGEFEAVKMIASESLKAEVYSAARGLKEDIDVAMKAGVEGINIIIPTSDLHISQKLEKTREQVLDMVEESVGYVKAHGLDAELSMEDGSRTDAAFLKQVIGKAIKSGVDRATICDTVGVLNPVRAFKLFSGVREEFPDIDLGVHCHDDFGLSVANSLEALRAGANVVHATVNGIGERAGNASLEEIAVALRVMYNVKVNIKTELLQEASQLVSRLTGVLVSPNKSIVGKNAFAHESGIHTHAILKNPLTYESINPEIVGAARRIVSGKHSGSYGLRKILEEMGLQPSKEEFVEIVNQVKSLGDKGEKLTDSDLFEMALKVMGMDFHKPVELEEFIVVTGNKITPTASVKLKMNGAGKTEAATGVGPVDATLNAISRAISLEEKAYLDTYHVEAITGGTDAFVNVEIMMRKGDRIVSSRGVSEDIVMASVEAYMKSMNLLLNHKIKSRRGGVENLGGC